MTTYIMPLNFGTCERDFEACSRYLRKSRDHPVETGHMAEYVNRSIQHHTRVGPIRAPRECGGVGGSCHLSDGPVERMNLAGT